MTIRFRIACRERADNLRRACLVSAALVGGLLGTSVRAADLVALQPLQLWHGAEFRLSGAPTAKNNFDPEQIRIDAHVRTPTGETLTLPAFWFQEYVRRLANNTEELAAQGAPEWRIRFTPTTPGTYTIDVVAEVSGQKAQTVASGKYEVARVARAPARGWVRTAGLGLATSDGQSLRLIGQNICWADGPGTFGFDRYFDSLHQAGGNFARIWLAPWSMPLEHKPGTLNHYSLEAAWQLDQVFAQAERDGLYLMLSLDHHGMYQEYETSWGNSNSFWNTNPYSQAQGGPCAKPNDFFTNTEARKLYEKRLRYLIGRYAYSPNLLAWQFFNEIDNVIGPGKALDDADVVAWHRAMGDWLKAHDPYRHIVTTSLTGGSDRPEFWSLPEMDLAVYHSYGDANPARLIQQLSLDYRRRYLKPALVGEFGVSAREWARPLDPHLRGFRQGLWGGALGGSIGTAMPWWWQDMAKDDVYPIYATMHRVLSDARWDEGAWTPILFARQMPPDDLARPRADSELFTATLAMSGYQRGFIANQLAVANPLVAARAAEFISSYVLGTNEAKRQRPIQLTAIFGPSGRISLHVAAVANEAELAVTIDGKTAAQAALHSTGPREPLSKDSPRDFSIDVPEGKHVIQILNTGKDWANLADLKLTNLRPAEYPGDWSFQNEAVGLKRDETREAVLYVYAPDVAYPAGAQLADPPPREHSTIAVPAWPKGRFVARWTDPQKGDSAGETHGESDGNVLVLAVPTFRDDLIAIVRPE